MTRLVGIARTVAWTGGLAVALVWLLAPGSGLPDPPADRTVAGWRAWLDTTPAADVAAVGLRAAAVVLAAWLLLVLVAGLAAHALHAARAVVLLDRLSLGVLRRVLLPVAGAALVALPATPAGALTGSAVPTTTVPTTAATTTTMPDGPTAGWAVIRPLAPGEPPPTSTPSVPTPTNPPPTDQGPVAPAPSVEPPPAAAPAPPLPPDPAGTWLVAPGDHLWSIAETTLARAWGRVPADHEVAPYWVETIAANRSRLVVPHDPDLILPGQALVLPPVPAVPEIG